MDKKIEDYLHLYLGCQIDHLGDISELKYCRSDGYCWLGEYQYTTPYTNGEFTRPEMWALVRNCKPILRPLSDMTEKEKAKIKSMEIGYVDVYDCAKITKYLLSIYIDVFDLIEPGLAIDATTLKQTQHG